MTIVLPKEGFACPAVGCGEVFGTKADAMECHRDDRECDKREMFECPVCPVQFETADEARIHCREDSITQAYICDDCSETFSWIEDHEEAEAKRQAMLCCARAADEGATVYICRECGKEFSDADYEDAWEAAVDCCIEVVRSAGWECKKCGTVYGNRNDASTCCS